MQRRQQFFRVARRTALVYWFVASLWILFSDTALLLLGMDAVTLATASQFKGLAFVLVTALLLHVALSRQLQRLAEAHDALEVAEHRYRSLVQELPYGVLEFDGEGCIRFVNPAAEHMLGEAAEALYGRRLMDLINGGWDGGGVPGRTTRAEDVGPAVTGWEADFLRRDGRRVRVHLDWIPHRGSDGSHGYLGVLTDVTAIRQGEEARQRLAAVVEATPDLVLMSDAAGRLLDANQAARRRLGLGGDVLTGSRMPSLMPAWAWQRLERDGFPAASAEGAWMGETAYLDAEGREFPVSQVAIAHRDKDGIIRRFASIVRDISEQKRASQALHNSREQYRTLVENANEGLVVSQRGRLVYANPRMLHLQGYTLDDYLARPWLDFIHPDDRDAVLDWYRRQSRGDVVAMPYSFRLERKDGGICWVEATTASILWEGEPATLTFLTDVTEQIEARHRLDYLAEYDALTGLPNRRLFLARLARQVSTARRTGDPLAVIYVDLNRMRLVNDSHGHEAGDRLIREIAERLARIPDDPELAARISGDEFALGVTGVAAEKEVLGESVGRVLEAVSRPIGIGDSELFVSASAGISIFPSDGGEAVALLRNAASALELARRMGPGSYQFYSEQSDRRAADRLRLDAGLRRALERDEFELLYQPKADVRSGRVVGAEALLRWNRDGETVLPGVFVPILEETNLIREVGAWVLEQACRQQRHWAGTLDEGFRIAVNLSARQLADPHLTTRVAELLRKTGVDASGIELEITESSLVRDPDSAAATLQQLKDLGFTIAIDDFGTGYSSLAYFRRFPVDSLKIDKSFVHGIGVDKSSAEIARAICAMGHSLGTLVVGEGVETRQQLEVLRAYRCDQIQGFLLAPGLPVATFEQRMRDGMRLGPDHAANRRADGDSPGFADGR